MFSVGQLSAESLTRRKGQPAQVILLWEPSELPVLGGPQALVSLWVPSTVPRLLHLANYRPLGPLGEMGFVGGDQVRCACQLGMQRTQLDSERGRLEGTNESKVLSYKWQNERNHAACTEGRT